MRPSKWIGVGDQAEAIECSKSLRYTRPRNRPFQPRWYYAGKRVSEHLLKSWHLGWATGSWGVIDPGCLGSSQIDGRTMMEVYGKLGLHLGPAENAVDARMTEVREPFGFGAAESDGEPDELVSGVSQISPRRPGIRQDLKRTTT
jgi:hypothetical protein